MFPVHPDDALRLAEDRARAIRETWPRQPGLRPVTAEGLRRLAAWLDPPPAPLRPPRSSPLTIQLRR
jgi:hypothetical protein